MKESTNKNIHMNYILDNLEFLICKNKYKLFNIREVDGFCEKQKVFYFMNNQYDKIEVSFYQLKYLNLESQEDFIKKYNLDN